MKDVGIWPIIFRIEGSIDVPEPSFFYDVDGRGIYEGIEIAHDDNMPKSKKKDMWKKMNRARKMKRRERRQEDKDRKEKMRDEGKFSLFARPLDEERPRKRRRPPVQAEVLSEPSDELEL